MNVLITDPIDQQCLDILKAEGLDVDLRLGSKPHELIQAIASAHALIVRSQTTVTAELLEAGKQLKIVGRAGAGVDNIDVEAATRRGIIVMNTPGGNTISTAEHTMSLILSLARNIPQANQSLRSGTWDRKKFIGTELFEKTIGIVGLGKVGAEVAKRCRGFNMNVIAFDPVLATETASKLGVELVTLDELFGRSDYVTIHTPLIPETRGLIGEQSLKKCKRGVRIINCARGGIVDERALLKALDEGMVSGAALDVFETEPPKDFSLIQHPRVVATPHLGASTEEAQEKVAIQIAHQVADGLKERGIVGSVNADLVQFAYRKELKPYLVLAEKLGNLVGQLREGELRSLFVKTCGDPLRDYLEILASAVVKGICEKMLFEPVNYLNAITIAKERGIEIDFKHTEEVGVYGNVLSVKYETASEKRQFAGTVFGSNDVRVVSIDGFHFEFKPEGHLLLFSNIDRPGMLANVSTILAHNHINIAGLSLGRSGLGQRALTVVSLDNPISGSIVNKIASIDGVYSVRTMKL